MSFRCVLGTLGVAPQCPAHTQDQGSGLPSHPHPAQQEPPTLGRPETPAQGLSRDTRLGRSDCGGAEDDTCSWSVTQENRLVTQISSDITAR